MNDLILLIGFGTMLIFTAIWIVKRVEKMLKHAAETRHAIFEIIVDILIDADEEQRIIEKLVRRSIELGFWNLKGVKKIRR